MTMKRLALAATLSLVSFSAVAAPPQKAARPAADRGDRPASLAGTDVDGDLVVDARGHFVPTESARLLFDYFLTAANEESLADIQARTVREINARLKGPAAAEAVATLDRYYAFGQRAKTMTCARPGKADLEAALDQVHDLRREVLGRETADAFFGLEEVQDRATLAEMRVKADATGETQLTSAATPLPEDVVAVRAAVTAPLRLAQEEDALRANGAVPSEIRAARESAFGSDAADRLEALDRERAEFASRLSSYRSARAAIAAGSGTEGEKGAAIERLRAERFSTTERIRVDALDRMAAE